MKTNFHKLTLIVTTGLLLVGCGGKKKDAIQAVNPTVTPPVADARVNQVVSWFERQENGKVRYFMQFGTRDEQGHFHNMEWSEAFILDSSIEDGLFNGAERIFVDGQNKDGIKGQDVTADLNLKLNKDVEGRYLLTGIITGRDFREMGEKTIDTLPFIVMELNLVYTKMLVEGEKEYIKRNYSRRLPVAEEITPFFYGIVMGDPYVGTVTIYSQEEYAQKTAPAQEAERVA